MRWMVPAPSPCPPNCRERRSWSRWRIPVTESLRSVRIACSSLSLQQSRSVKDWDWGLIRCNEWSRSILEPSLSIRTQTRPPFMYGCPSIEQRCTETPPLDYGKESGCHFPATNRPSDIRHRRESVVTQARQTMICSDGGSRFCRAERTYLGGRQVGNAALCGILLAAQCPGPNP